MGAPQLTEGGVDSWPALPLAERMALQYRVEQFFYDEAALLDARRYEDWLALMAPDIHYWMPIRRTMSQREIAREFTRPGDMAFFNDDLRRLTLRVKKLGAGSAWSEDPPSRSRHYVSNVRITGIIDGDIHTDSCFYLYRARLNTEVDVWTGRREEILRPHGDSFQLVRRHLFIDQTLIRSTNMSTLF